MGMILSPEATFSSLWEVGRTPRPIFLGVPPPQGGERHCSGVKCNNHEGTALHVSGLLSSCNEVIVDISTKRDVMIKTLL